MNFVKLLFVLLIVSVLFIGCGVSERTRKYVEFMNEADHVYMITHYDTSKIKVLEMYYSFMSPLHSHPTDTSLVVYFVDVRGVEYYFYNDVGFKTEYIPEAEIDSYREDIKTYYDYMK